MAMKHHQCQNCPTYFGQWEGDVSHATRTVNTIQKAVSAIREGPTELFSNTTVAEKGQLRPCLGWDVALSALYSHTQLRSHDCQAECTLPQPFLHAKEEREVCSNIELVSSIPPPTSGSSQCMLHTRSTIKITMTFLKNGSFTECVLQKNKQFLC